MSKGCELDTDGDGDCPAHPQGCVAALQKEVARLQDRLKICEPHPFPPGTDAADLWRMREKAYTDRIAYLEEQMKPLLIAGDGSGPEFAPYFMAAARRPEYWQEMTTLVREHEEELREALERIVCISEMPSGPGGFPEGAEGMLERLNGVSGYARKALGMSLSGPT